MPMVHKRGIDFVRGGQFPLSADGLSVTDMTGWAGNCELRSQSGALIQTLAFTWLDAAERLFKVEASSAENALWPLGTHQFDIELTTAAGQKAIGLSDRLILVDRLPGGAAPSGQDLSVKLLPFFVGRPGLSGGAASISNDPGNALVPGTDGGIFVPDSATEPQIFDYEGLVSAVLTI